MNRTASATTSREFRKKAESQAFFWVPWLVIAGLIALKIVL